MKLKLGCISRLIFIRVCDYSYRTLRSFLGPKLVIIVCDYNNSLYNRIVWIRDTNYFSLHLKILVQVVDYFSLNSRS